MVNSNNVHGKHLIEKDNNVRGKFVKNNPYIKKNLKNRIFAYGAVLLFAISSVSPYIKGSDVIIDESPLGYESMVNRIDLSNLESTFEELYSFYEKYEVDESIPYYVNSYDKSFVVMLNYLQNLFSSLDDSEKINLISNFEFIRDDVINYVKNYFGVSTNLDDFIVIEPCSDDYTKLNGILKDEKLMDYISEYSFKYRISKSLLVALAAYNYGNSSSNVMGIKSEFFNIDSSRYVYEFTEDGKPIKHNLLDTFKFSTSSVPANVHYATQVVCQCLKTDGSNFIYEYLPDDVDKEAAVNEILNYVFCLENDRILNFDYYTLKTEEFVKKTISFVYSDYDKYLDNIFTEIMGKLYSSSLVYDMNTSKSKNM